MGKSFVVAGVVLLSWVGFLHAGTSGLVRLSRVPEGGLQPQAMLDDQGTLHLVYLKGDPKACDVYYTRRDAGRTNFAAVLRVNSEPGSAIAVGTIRGAHIALSRNGRVHVAWNGNGNRKSDRGAPMLYARLNDPGSTFEAQRNLMSLTRHLDGGGSVAADDAGNVFVVWHAALVDGPEGEQHRAVFLAKSSDDGSTFAAERRINPTATGACACCGLKAFADKQGRLGVLYRSAQGGLDRDVTLLLSRDQGKTFQSTTLGAWRVATCPMSSMSLISARGDSMLAAWETKGQVFQTAVAIETLEFPEAQTPGQRSGSRKHPVLAMTDRPARRTLLAWTEGTGWQKGGSLAWELTELDTSRETTGRAPGVPVWSFVAAVAEADGTFTIFY